MLQALVLFRFGDPRIGAFVRSEVIPIASEHFRVATIEHANGAPGTPEYWTNIFNAVSSVCDAVISVEFIGETFSRNVSFEQFFINGATTEQKTTARTDRSIYLQAFAMPQEAADYCGAVQGLKITVDPERARFSTTSSINGDRGSLQLCGPMATPADREACAAALRNAFDAMRAACTGRLDPLRQMQPMLLDAIVRLRHLVRADPIIGGAVVFHAPEDQERAAVEIHPQEKWIVPWAQRLVNNPESVAMYGKAIDPLTKRPELSQAQFDGMLQFHALFPYIARNGERAAPWIFHRLKRPGLAKAALLTVMVASIVMWPIYRVGVYLKRFV